MIKNLFLALAASTVLALSACATDGGDKAAAAGDDFTKQVEAVKAEIKDLNKQEALWRDTEEFVKEAEEAYAKGDKETAMKKLKKAQFEVSAARKQAESQTSVKPLY